MEGICAVGGLRAQPSREDLRMFVESVASLNGARVAELLQAKMVSRFQALPECIMSRDSLNTFCCNASRSVCSMMSLCNLCCAQDNRVLAESNRSSLGTVFAGQQLSLYLQSCW